MSNKKFNDIPIPQNIDFVIEEGVRKAMVEKQRIQKRGFTRLNLSHNTNLKNIVGREQAFATLLKFLENTFQFCNPFFQALVIDALQFIQLGF